MQPWSRIAVAHAPGSGAELSLWRRGGELVIRAGTADLMSSRMHGSEDALAEHGCGSLGQGARVLIGGLGMGFTLRAALGVLPASARVVVAELVPAIVDWVRGPIGGGALLDDPRVSVEVRDCAVILREAAASFDAVVLDVDNGPAALTQRSNAWLYGAEGLAAAARAIRPGGRLAVWSAGSDATFVRRLSDAGFDPKVIPARAHRGSAGSGPRQDPRQDPRQGGRGVRHSIFVGVRRATCLSAPKRP